MPITTNPPGINPQQYTHIASADSVFALNRGSDGSITASVHETWMQTFGSPTPPPMYGDGSLRYSAQEVASAESAIVFQVQNFYGDQSLHPDTATKDDYTALLVHDAIVSGEISYSQAAKCYGSAHAQDGSSFMSHVLANPALADSSYTPAINAVRSAQVDLARPTDMLIAGLYTAFYHRAPDAAGLAYWQSQMQAGATVYDIARAFSSHPNFQATFGGLDNAGYVALLYQNVLGSAGDAAGLAYWTNRLDVGVASRTTLVADFVASAMNTDLEGALAGGNISRADYDAGVVRQNTLLDKAQLGLYFAHSTYYMGVIHRADSTDHLYHASELAISKVTADPNTEVRVENALFPYAQLTDPAALETTLVTLVGTM